MKKTNKPEFQCKHFLSAASKLATQIRDQQKELSFWNNARVSGAGDGLEEKIQCREKEIEKNMWELLQRKLMLTKLIDRIDDPIARIIYRNRYIFDKTWASIAEICGGMSERNARYIHDNAMPDLEEIYCNLAPTA